MTENEIVYLIERLNNVRLRREAAVRVIGQSDRQEVAIVRRIQIIQSERPRDTARPRVTTANTTRHKNLIVGQNVRITNCPRTSIVSLAKSFAPADA